MSDRSAPRTYEVTIEGETVRAIVKVEGRWIAATWGYSGGSPAEGPDASIIQAWRSDMDEDGTETEVDPSVLTRAEQDALIEVALERDQDRDSEGDER